VNFLFLLLVMGGAGFLQGVSVFGFAVIAAPLGLFFYDPVTLVVIFAVISIFLNAYLSLKIKTHLDNKLW
jgi:uncharacterized membrane protein YfcA